MVLSASGELDGVKYAFSLTAIDRYAHAINLVSWRSSPRLSNFYLGTDIDQCFS